VIDKTVTDAEAALQRAQDDVGAKLAAIAPAKLTAALFDRVLVDYYGTPTPMNQLAAIHLPEARLLLVTPFDHSTTSAVAQAIAKAYPTWAVGDDGTTIRVMVPQPTDAQRHELIKQATVEADTGKITIRNVNRKATSDLDRAVKDGTATAADVADAKDTLGTLVADALAAVDAALSRTTARLLEV